MTTRSLSVEVAATRRAATRIARRLLADVGLPQPSGGIEITGRGDPIGSPYRVSAAAAAVVVAATGAVAEVERTRTGRAQRVTVDLHHAAAAFASERAVRSAVLDGATLNHPLTRNYRTADGWIRIHANLAHHRAAALGVLACDAADVAAVARRWYAADLERALHAAGGVAAMMRTSNEWQGHLQAHAVARRRLVDVRTGVALSPLTLAPASSPLGGVRVLDMTRILAGPVCGRFLAGYGATVLRVDAPHLNDGELLDADTGVGKRRCSLDLRRAHDRRLFERLAGSAHIILHGSRPGALEALGYGPTQLGVIAPDAVIGQLSAYGTTGPWATRRGFDSIVQVATGIAHTCGFDHARGPAALPVQALDHATGYLLALGVLRAFIRRLGDGTAGHVEVSLAATGRWLSSLRAPWRRTARQPDAGAHLTTLTDGHYAPVTVVAPPGRLTDHRPVWSTGPVARGTHMPRWP